MFNKFLKKQKEKLEKQNKLIENAIQEASSHLDDINRQVSAQEQNLNSLHNNFVMQQQELNNCLNQLGIVHGVIEATELGLEYVPVKNDLNELEKEISDIIFDIGRLLSLNQIIQITNTYKIDGSITKGEKFQQTFCKNLVTAFNIYFEKKKKAVTSDNFEQTQKLIVNKFSYLNNQGKIVGVNINKDYLTLCLKLLSASLDKKIAEHKEKEKIKEERKRLHEQEKLLAEAEKAKAELQKQRRMYEQSLAKALNEQERAEFEAKLKEIDKREADVDYRIANSHAGYLYITSTKAMPNMVKIGVTRRLNPLVRIQELSTASTPFPFVCHGLVFSDDVFDLETKVHNYFDKTRVNTENKHKEFFYIDVGEAIRVLKEEFGCEVHFVDEEMEEDE